MMSFNNSTVKQFEDALKNLQNNGVQALIFDLRNNSGGAVDSVCKILNMLLPSGIIATQRTLDGRETVLGMSDENELNIPMITITNKNTASAAELFVCDLKDYNKASQVGQTTYGIGLKPDVEVTLDENKESLYLKGQLDLRDDDQYQVAVNLLKNSL